jgi:hypothetical protein
MRSAAPNCIALPLREGLREGFGAGGRLRVFGALPRATPPLYPLPQGEGDVIACLALIQMWTHSPCHSAAGPAATLVRPAVPVPVGAPARSAPPMNRSLPLDMGSIARIRFFGAGATVCGRSGSHPSLAARGAHAGAPLQSDDRRAPLGMGSIASLRRQAMGPHPVASRSLPPYCARRRRWGET